MVIDRREKRRKQRLQRNSENGNDCPVKCEIIVDEESANENTVGIAKHWTPLFVLGFWCYYIFFT